MTYPYQPGPPPELPPPNDPVPQGVPVQPMYYYPPAYPYQPYQGYQPATEGLAIASLVVSCVAIAGLCAYGLGALLGPVGAILGHVARRRIDQRLRRCRPRPGRHHHRLDHDGVRRARDRGDHPRLLDLSGEERLTDHGRSA